MHGMGDAAGLRPRTVDVLPAQSKDLIEGVFPRRHAAGHHDHCLLPSAWSRRRVGSAEKSGTSCAASAASVNAQCFGAVPLLRRIKECALWQIELRSESFSSELRRENFLSRSYTRPQCPMASPQTSPCRSQP